MKRVCWAAAVAAVAASALTGCVTVQQVQISNVYDPALVAPLLAPGNNHVTGSALIRQSGGGVVTCAGTPVELVPATPYAKEWARLLFGSDQQGYRSVMGGATVITNVDPQFVKAVRSTTCNAQGFFTFADVADGDFYTLTRIQWRVGDSMQGGTLMKAFSVRGGQKQEIVMAP